MAVLHEESTLQGRLVASVPVATPARPGLRRPCQNFWRSSGSSGAASVSSPDLGSARAASIFPEPGPTPPMENPVASHIVVRVSG
ncbi:hypothetical protein MTP99_009004 [Tenebrio molitor]|nr:hypothetical protein MTP99_009004 [Tenebrio molitor]